MCRDAVSCFRVFKMQQLHMIAGEPLADQFLIDPNRLAAWDVALAAGT